MTSTLAWSALQLNERGHYEAWGKSQAERISVEIDSSVIQPERVDPETLLLKMPGFNGQLVRSGLRATLLR
jgi:hypothetical protein